jgi:hypothetical protein
MHPALAFPLLAKPENKSIPVITKQRAPIWAALSLTQASGTEPDN